MKKLAAASPALKNNKTSAKAATPNANPIAKVRKAIPKATGKSIGNAQAASSPGRGKKQANA